jgi:hemoglobin-like flavoprotein
MLTWAQKKMIRESFEQVQPKSEAAAHLFYGRLFELDPSLRPMFRGDLAQQGRQSDAGSHCRGPRDRPCR